MSSLGGVEEKQFLHELRVTLGVKLEMVQLLVGEDTVFVGLMAQVNQLLQVTQGFLEEHEGGECADEVLAHHDHRYACILVLHLRVVHWESEHLAVVDYRCYLRTSHERPLMFDGEEVPAPRGELFMLPKDGHTIGLCVGWRIGLG